MIFNRGQILNPLVGVRNVSHQFSTEDLPEDNILIIGGGPSSMDIAEEAAVTKGAKNTTLATRKPHLGIPDK
jgi:cation diffusion facilitator CzcD-associated flavoprotein CzcO